jgi:hypothetical protein
MDRKSAKLLRVTAACKSHVKWIYLKIISEDSVHITYYGACQGNSEKRKKCTLFFKFTLF